MTEPRVLVEVDMPYPLFPVTVWMHNPNPDEPEPDLPASPEETP